MSDRSLIFPSAEYRSRIDRLQREMAVSHLDALLLTTPADIFYVTGFLTRFWESPARPWFVVTPSSGDPIAVIPRIGADLMGRTWIKDIRTWDAPNPDDDGVTLLSDTIAGVTAPSARIGIPSGLETHARMPLTDLRKVEQLIAPRVFVDGTSAIQRTREIKSEPEIATIKASCQIADRAFARVPEFAAIGRPLDRVFRDFQIALLDEGADWVSYVAGGAEQNGYGDVISPAAPKPLEQGDVLMLDTGAVKDGYFCDFDRNYSLGPVSGATRKVHHALWQATDDLMSELRPEMLACDAHRILSEALIRYGVKPSGGRFGHGLGINLTEWPSFSPVDRTPLRENMVLTIEPGAWVTDDRILVHEENIVLRADGCELLSDRAPYDMPEIG